VDVRPHAAATSAFGLLTLIGGLNFVAVRFSNAELAPLWGAGSRFFLAGLILLALAALMRWPLPRGAALTGTLLYSVLNFAVFYALMYWALLYATAGYASVALALTPLLTLILASLQRLERLTLPRVGGALVAVAGIAIVFHDQLSAQVPLLALLALVGAGLAGAQSAIVLKRFPAAHPMTRNGVAMAVAGVLLYGLSRAAGEERLIPQERATWAAFLYLVLIGSMLLFFLLLFVIARWTASATSYAFVLFPVVAVAAGALLADERVTPTFLAGTALVMVGVWLGALRPHATPPTGAAPASVPVKPR
jgi:drug/metabolite transporter (DMT)-like permease